MEAPAGRMGEIVSEYRNGEGELITVERLPQERQPDYPCKSSGDHQWDDGDSMSQGGFYLLCLRCGEQEWT